MTCQQVQDELLLYAGVEEFPAELSAHLAECRSCREFHQELMVVTGGLGSDDDFQFAESDIEAACRRVDRRLAANDSITPVWSRWMPALRVAASVVMVLGVSMLAFLMGRYGFNGDAQRAAVDDSGTSIMDVALAYDVDDTELEMDESTIHVLIDEVTLLPAAEAGRDVLDDLTDAEFEHLKENFDVGDLL